MTTSCGDQVVQDGILGYEKSPDLSEVLFEWNRFSGSTNRDL